MVMSERLRKDGRADGWVGGVWWDGGGTVLRWYGAVHAVVRSWKAPSLPLVLWSWIGPIQSWKQTPAPSIEAAVAMRPPYRQASTMHRVLSQPAKSKISLSSQPIDYYRHLPPSQQTSLQPGLSYHRHGPTSTTRRSMMLACQPACLSRPSAQPGGGSNPSARGQSDSWRRTWLGWVNPRNTVRVALARWAQRRPSHTPHCTLSRTHSNPVKSVGTTSVTTRHPFLPSPWLPGPRLQLSAEASVLPAPPRSLPPAASAPRSPSPRVRSNDIDHSGVTFRPRFGSVIAFPRLDDMVRTRY